MKASNNNNDPGMTVPSQPQNRNTKIEHGAGIGKKISSKYKPHYQK